MFIGVNEQVLTERGVTESCTVTSQEKIYVRSGDDREPKYEHTLELPDRRRDRPSERRRATASTSVSQW